MRFTGTHIPGQHRLVAQNPPQIQIPERKITSAEEAAKWHASRGGAAPEEEDGGGTPILLPGLAAGWALTGGPQQTLSSAGVVASGPANMSAVGGSVAYGAGGAVIDELKYLITSDAVIALSDESFLWCAMAKNTSDNEADVGYAFYYHDDPGFNCEAYLSLQRGVNNVVFGISGDGSYPEVVVNVPGGVNQNTMVIAYADKTRRKIGLSVNGAAAQEADAPGPWGFVAGDLRIGDAFLTWVGDGAMTVLQARMWIGANAETIAGTPASMTLLATNPTDAILAAYTG